MKDKLLAIVTMAAALIVLLVIILPISIYSEANDYWERLTKKEAPK